jgi:hypothetical protein
MSWRIEQTHPLHLLQELPDQWAQTCITSPPQSMAAEKVLAVLHETYRVLRSDGTLWLDLHGYQDTHELVWQLRQTPWLRPTRANRTPKQTLLLAKTQTFLFKAQHGPPRFRARRPACTPNPHRTQGWDCRRFERRGCTPAGMMSVGAVGWCVLASTTSRACEVCGAPSSRRTRRAGRLACVHRGDRGRCLVIDPFCRVRTGIAAVSQGRHYLGIEPDPARAQTVRTRLSLLEKWQ